MTKTKTKKRALEDRLGAVLGRSWVDLGALWASKKWSSGGSHFFLFTLLNEQGVKRRLGTDLGSI